MGCSDSVRIRLSWTNGKSSTDFCEAVDRCLTKLKHPVALERPRCYMRTARSLLVENELAASVLLLSPAWPPGEVANGIVSTVATAKKGLESLGVRCSVLSMSRALRGEDRSNNVFCAAAFDQKSGARRYHEKLMRKLQQVPVFTKLFGPPNNPAIQIPGIDMALAFILQRNAVDLIEVEESFGLPDYVACTVRAVQSSRDCKVPGS